MSKVIQDKGDGIFLLCRKTHGAASTIPGECEIIDSNTGATRVMRLVKGANLYKDQQSERDQEKRAENPVFRKGMLIVGKHETKKLQYLRECSYNKANGGNLFFEYNPKGEAEKTVNKELEYAEAITLIYRMTPYEVKAVYLSMKATSKNGINYQYVEQADTDTLRAELMALAKKDATKIKQATGNQANANMYYIYKAGDLNRIIIDHASSTIKWPGGGDVIYRTHGGDVVKSLAEAAVNDDHYFAIINTLKEAINPNKEADKKFDMETQRRSADTFEYTTDDDYIELLDRLVDSGKAELSDNRAWYKFNLPGATEPLKLKGKKGALEHIKAHSDFRQYLIRMDKE